MTLLAAANKSPPSDGQIDGDKKVTVHFPLTFSSYSRKLSSVMKTVLTILLTITFLPVLQAAEQPNILAIMVDDLGYGDLASYGATDLKSPHLDKLVGSGMKFTHFYANCPVCSPTRASFVTGRYPELVGVPGVVRTHAEDNWGYLARDVVTLGHKMQEAGYHTALIGKWHLGLTQEHWPNNRGFHFFHGWLGDMMDDYYLHTRHDIHYMRRNTTTIHPQGHATDLFTQWACDYLQEQKDSEQPFFLFLSYNAPHTPIQPPPQWLEKVKQREKGLSKTRAQLVALIEHMDWGIGQVLEQLDALGLTEDTVVIFTSDNGGQVNVGGRNGPLRDGKQSMYEGGLRVATSVSWPGHIPPGTVTSRRALTMDLYPTLCEIAGVPIHHTIDGQSLLPTLLGNNHTSDTRDFFFHRREGGNRYGGLTTHAIIRENWKLLQNSPFESLELYNLSTDPLEQNNLAEKNREKFNELAKALRVQIQRGGAVPWQAPTQRNRP